MVLWTSGARANEIEYIIAQEARAQGFPVQTAIAVARVESALNPKAVGPKGEVGLFQLMKYNAPRVAMYSPRENAKAGILLLKKYKLECADMGQYWIICYNQGPNRRPKHPQLHPYYKKVQGAMK